MVSIYTTDAAEKVLNSKTAQWVHIFAGIQVPPTSHGSYNYLLWDIIQRRSPKDLLISRYYRDAYQIAQEKGGVIAYIDDQKASRESIHLKRFRIVLARLLNKPIIPPFFRAAIQLVERSGCQNILLWEGIGHLGVLRQNLPDCTIAFAQRQYEYPLSKSDYSQCDLLVAQTRGQIKLAHRRMGTLTPYTVVIKNGVETDQYRPPTATAKQEIRAKLGIPDNSFVLIFPSRLAPEKGTYFLERWINLCQGKQPNWHFLVVGYAQPQKTSAAFQRQLEHTLRTKDNVTWIPGASRTDMPQYYQAADICLLPSVCNEGFPMACLEAMATEVPVVAAAKGALPEIIKTNYNGLLLRPEYLTQDFFDAVKLLQSDKALLDTVSRNARAYVETKLTRTQLLQNFDAFLEGRFEDIDEDLSFPE